MSAVLNQSKHLMKYVIRFKLMKRMFKPRVSKHSITMIFEFTLWFKSVAIGQLWQDETTDIRPQQT